MSKLKRDDDEKKQKVIDIMIDRDLFERSELINILSSKKDFEELIEEALE